MPEETGRAVAASGEQPAGGHSEDHVVPETIEGVLAALRAEGGRVTTPRRLLIAGLIEAGGHRTAEQLAETVHAKAPDVHLSTIYRNLDELERLGVVAHSHLGHGPATYHLASEVHGHFVCADCGALFEAPDRLFASLAAVALEEHHFRIDPHHFAILGRCEACAAAADAAP